PRYRWVGAVSHEAAMQLLSTCELFVLSSRAEGGANAIAEAVVCGKPILCSDIPGNVGMLDSGYPGYFHPGDTEQLAKMLNRAETDGVFMNELRSTVLAKQDRFSPGAEIAQWKDLLRPFSSLQL